MANDPTRAAFWKHFLLEKCAYPAPALLRRQLDHAELSEDCACGCNSYKVRIDPAHAEPLLPPEAEPRGTGRIFVFEANFRMPDDLSLEVMIFANDRGHLDYVEVDCCFNSYPVPDAVVVEEPPYHWWAAETLFRET